MKGDIFFKQFSRKPPFSKMHPKVAAFFKEYLANEKVIPFKDQYVMNTHFPPFPSLAFDNLVENFDQIGDSNANKLFSVTLAVTNRCPYKCWHCYNAGRSQQDLPLDIIKEVVSDLQNMGAIMVTLSGGEPLIREDLEEIADFFDKRTCLNLNTTGFSLTHDRALKLKENNIFGIGVSLDSIKPEEHEILRGMKGAFDTAIQCLHIGSECGLYPYVISIATKDFLNKDRFDKFIRFSAQSGAREVHLLEPSATGKLIGKSEVHLNRTERQLILEYQKEIAQDESLPILSSFTYLESKDAFGCGAGLTHLYIDGSGEVCPCNLVPLSFGNIKEESLENILKRMKTYFIKPRQICVGRTLSKYIPHGPMPVPLELSKEICEKHLSKTNRVPRFFKVRSDAKGDVGKKELKSAYNRIHSYYDEFWLKEAGEPIEILVDKLGLNGDEAVFEAGCGTGFGTLLIAQNLSKNGKILAADISPGMIKMARQRAKRKKVKNILFILGDALNIMERNRPFDIIFSSWVLGYIKLNPFFIAAKRNLKKGGKLAFIVHKDKSPYEPLEIFEEIVIANPSVLLKRVKFDFPRNMDHITLELQSAGLEVDSLWDGNITFRYKTPDDVLEHLLKSGAGTAYYDAVEPQSREALERDFLIKLAERRKGGQSYDVIHDYIACVAKSV
ncbi:MAG: radical SAM protein [bacterium]